MLKELPPGVKDHGTGNPLTLRQCSLFTTLVLNACSMDSAACFLRDGFTCGSFCTCFFVTNWITAVLRADLKRLGLFGECYLEIFFQYGTSAGVWTKANPKPGWADIISVP